MPRNSSGTYSLPAGNPVVSGTVIASTWANNTLSDISTALTGSLSRSGQGAMQAQLQLTDGAVGTPALSFASEVNGGLYRAGAGDFRLSISANDVIRIKATGVTFFGSSTAALDGYSVNIDSTIPGIFFNDSDAAANTKGYFILANAGSLQFGLYNDAFTSNACLVFNRTAGAWSSVIFGSSDNPTYTFTGTGLSSFAGQVRFTGNLNPTSSATTAVYTGIQSTNVAMINSIDSTAAADGKIWRQYATGTSYTFDAANDAYNATKLWLQAVRSGTAITNINFGNATDNPTFTFLGTGASTFTGNVNVTESTNGAAVLTITNVNSGASALTATYLVNNAANFFRMLFSSSTNVTAYTTNGPTGAAGYFYTTGGDPISIGTNGVERIRVSGTGAVTVKAPTSGDALTVNAVAGSTISAAVFNGSTTAGGRGITVLGGTASTDFCAVFQNATGGTNLFLINGDGGLQVASPTGGDKGLGTINVATGYYLNGVAFGVSGSFTGTLTGMTAGTTGTVSYTITNGLVCLYLAADILGTSNTTSMTMTGLPAAVQPTSSRSVTCSLEDNSVLPKSALASITGGTITFALGVAGNNTWSTTGFTASATKGCTQVWTIVYPL